MSKVRQDWIDKAKSLGIVPGAQIVCAIDGTDEGVVPPYTQWIHNAHSLYFTKDDLHIYICGQSGGCWATVLTPAPSQGLQENDAVTCSETMRRAIWERAGELNFPRSGSFDLHAFPDLCVYTGQLGTKSSGGSGWNHLSVPEFLSRLEQTKKPVPVIKIDGQEVKFSAEGISFGSRAVDRKTVLAVAERLEGKAQRPELDLRALKGKSTQFPTGELRLACFSRLLALGVPCNWEIEHWPFSRATNLCISNGNIETGSNRDDIPYGEFMEAIEKQVRTRNISVDGYIVQFTDTGITVGCQSIPKQTVLDIAERLRAIA